MRDGYKLKLNSYDLGVDIELARRAAAHPLRASGGAQRRRDERARTASSARAPTSSCSACPSHAWKVNFCKFTNETRNGIEDASRHSGLKFLAAVNGTCAGGGYELALACDEIWLVDDRSSSVALPEVPLLGVLPGTGGLTRLTDKRHVRHDLADVFCTRDGRRARATREGLAPRRRDREAGRVRGQRCARGRWRSPSAATGPRDAHGRRADAARARDDDARLSLPIRRRRHRPRRAHGDVHRARPRPRAARRHRRHRSRAALRGGRCSSRASSTTRS